MNIGLYYVYICTCIASVCSQTVADEWYSDTWLMSSAASWPASRFAVSMRDSGTKSSFTWAAADSGTIPCMTCVPIHPTYSTHTGHLLITATSCLYLLSLSSFSWQITCRQVCKSRIAYRRIYTQCGRYSRSYQAENCINRKFTPHISRNSVPSLFPLRV